VLGGPESLEVVGESFHQDVLRAIVGPSESYVRVPVVATLCPESDNGHDPNAIAVWISGSQVGHLSREDAVRFRSRILALHQQAGGWIGLPGVVVGGGEGRPSYGVFLDYEPATFGLGVVSIAKDRSRGHLVGERVRTGLSMAVVSDAQDDSLDLGWRAGIPEEQSTISGGSWTLSERQSADISCSQASKSSCMHVATNPRVRWPSSTLRAKRITPRWRPSRTPWYTASAAFR